MEKVALKNALTRLKRVLDVVEVATDASASIKKMIGKYNFLVVNLCPPLSWQNDLN